MTPTVDAADAALGLTTDKARRRLQADGPNNVADVSEHPLRRALQSILLVIYALSSPMPRSAIPPLILVALLASIPVALPSMFTLAAAIGARALARRGVLPTRLSAVDEAAGIDILCCDKTGTLTRNELAVTHVAREREHFWRSRPGSLLVLSSIVDIALFTTLAANGILMKALPLATLAELFLAALAFAFILDAVKLMAFRRLSVT